eukprot:766666-Hanusia_phi.AAC.5
MAASIIINSVRRRAAENGEEAAKEESFRDVGLTRSDAPNKRMREGLVEKKFLSSSGLASWQQRYAILSESFLVLADPEDRETVIDMIPLIDVLRVSTRANRAETSSASLSSFTKDKDKDKGKEEEEEEETMIVRTIPGGRNCGRNYTFRMPEGDFWEWYEEVKAQVEMAKQWHEQMKLKEEIGSSWLNRSRHWVSEEEKREGRGKEEER